MGGKCISSRSPCVNAISHQITAKPNQDSTKLRANTINVQRHCESTNVVKMSCRNRIRRWAIFFWITLHSPFFSTARRLTLRVLPGRRPRLLNSEKYKNTIYITVFQFINRFHCCCKHYVSFNSSYSSSSWVLLRRRW